MKYICLLLGFLSLFVSCKTSVYPTRNVTFQSFSNGVLQARCVGLGKNAQSAMDDAEKTLVYTLLFRGLPNSGQESPLLSIDESECERTHPDYLNTLFGESMRCKTFILSSIPVSDVQKVDKKEVCVTTEVKVNLKALRLDLEKQGLIRKFGY